MKLLKSTESTTRSFLLLLSFIFANTFVQSVHCFLGDVPRVGPSQQHLEKSQLQIQLILENNDNVPMALKGLTMELTDIEYSKNEKDIQIRQTPSYIGIDGETQVAMESGRWEMRWNDPELESKYQYDGVGNLICRFEIPHEVRACNDNRTFFFFFLLELDSDKKTCVNLFVRQHRSSVPKMEPSFHVGCSV